MKLIAAKNLAKSIKGLNQARAEATLSLAYYGLNNGNVSALAGLPRDIVNDLHPEYRRYVPASFDNKSGQWVYNRAKAEKINADYSFEFGKIEWDAFVDALTTTLVERPELTDQEKRDKSIDSAKRALQKAIGLGVDIATLELLLQQVKNAQVQAQAD